MDPLIASGALIVGIGIGLTEQRSNPKSEPGPVTCHCECSGDKQPPVQSVSTFREIELALVAVESGNFEFNFLLFLVSLQLTEFKWRRSGETYCPFLYSSLMHGKMTSVSREGDHFPMVLIDARLVGLRM